MSSRYCIYCLFFGFVSNFTSFLGGLQLARIISIPACEFFYLTSIMYCSFQASLRPNNYPAVLKLEIYQQSLQAQHSTRGQQTTNALFHSTRRVPSHHVFTASTSSRRPFLFIPLCKIIVTHDTCATNYCLKQAKHEILSPVCLNSDFQTSSRAILLLVTNKIVLICY